MKMSPDQQQMMMAAIQAAMTGEKEGAIDLPDGTRMFIEKPDVPGVKAVITSSDGGMLTTIYDQLEQRPDAYVATLPFLPGLPCAAGEQTGGRTFVTWFGLKDVDAAIAQLVHQSELSGWRRGADSPENGMFGMRDIVFTKAGSMRQIMGMSFGPMGFASCTDKPSD